MVSVARYDGLAEWYEGAVRGEGLAADEEHALERLLARGAGRRCLDVGCGTGAAAPALEALGWRVTGVDVSEDQLRFARRRGVETVRAPAERLPFADETFDAAVSLWTHTDVDDWHVAVREVARVLHPGAPFVYVGAHPCFVGPHSRFPRAEGVPELHRGYRRTDRYDDGPGVTPDGLRARVGASHLPLGLFVESFLAAGLRLEAFAEGSEREYPHAIAMRWRR
jgi:SAM-dependent methyltransferase